MIYFYYNITAKKRNISLYALIIVWKSIPNEGKRQCKRKNENENTDIKETIDKYFSTVIIVI